MNNEIEKFTYNVPQCYLELARSAFTSLHSMEERDKIANKTANALFALASTSIIYSYMAIEAFVNSQLYQIWAKRSSDTSESKNFNAEFSNTNEFISLKTHKSIRELTERLKTLCRLLGYKQIHDEDQNLWQEFNDLVDKYRHFLIHPFPDPVKFNETMKIILEQNKAGLYVEVAEKILKHLYNQSKKEIPDWVQKNCLLKNRGYTLFSEE